MSSSRSLGDKSITSSVSLPFTLFDLKSGPGFPASRFYAEDGWIFREYPGKGIEIICRYDAPAMASALQET
jgi:hypothetical protein